MIPSTSAAAGNRTNSPSRTSQETAQQDTIDKARDAIGRGDIPGALRTLSARFDGNWRDFHGAVLSLMDSPNCRDRQTIIEETLRQHPSFNPNSFDRQGKTALDLAVRHDDREFASYLLRNGADPQHTPLAPASVNMKTLVAEWRRKNLLYAHFDGQNTPSLTAIDRELREGRHEEVRAWLEDILKKHGTSKVWKKAMNDGRHDILRALLVVGKPDELRELTREKLLVGEWIDKLRGDPGLVDALKEFPYQSALRGEPKHLNCEVKFPSGEKISCGHLATTQILMRLKDPQLKIDYSKLNSKKNIALNVRPDVEKTSDALKAQASETHLVSKGKFGQFLTGQFEAMEKEGKLSEGKLSRQMLLETTKHAMSLALTIKEKDGKKSYVAQFYDPNDTSTDARSEMNCSKTFETQTLEDYIPKEWRMRSYYPDPKAQTMIYVVSEGKAQTGGANSPASGAGRRLSTPLDPKDIDSATVWHLMERGYAEDLGRLRDHFNTLPPYKRIELLSGRYGDRGGATPLYLGVGHGHVDAVKVFGEMLASIPSIQETQLLDVLAGKFGDHRSALYVGMGYGHVDAVKAYGEIVMSHSSLPANKQADLLLAKISEGPEKGKSGLYAALGSYRNHFGAAKVQIELLNRLAPKLSEDKRKEVLNELNDQEQLILSSRPFWLNWFSLLEWRGMHASFAELKTALGG